MPKEMSSYPSGFGHGVLLQELPVAPLHRKVFYVGNNTTKLKGETGASNSNNGSFYKPLSTIDYAIGLCSSGDLIIVRPGYSETITAADSILFDVEGVTLIGLGSGSTIPTIEYNHANATVGISADNVSIYNINFNSSITGVTVGVNVKANADHVKISGCRFDCDAAGTDEFLHSIRFVDNNSYCIVENCIIDMGIAGATVGIHLDADTANLTLRNNIIRGDYSTACIAGDTTLSTYILIEDNLLVNGNGGDINTEPGIELLTGTHGIIRRNDIVCNLATKSASIVADTCLLFENYYNEDITGTGGLIGTASADD